LSTFYPTTENFFTLYEKKTVNVLITWAPKEPSEKASMATVCKKHILLDIHSMITVLICSITVFLLHLQVMRIHQLDVSQQAQSGIKKIATFCSGILPLLDYGLVAC